MCNQYKLTLIDGVWRWLPVKNSRPLDRVQGELSFSGETVAYTYVTTPNRAAPVIRKRADGALEMVEMRFGFPHWEDQSKVLTNIRNLASGYWRPWLEPQWRCLVPVDEFCEVADESDFSHHWFKLKGEEPFCFAGVWRPWKGRRGRVTGEHELFAFVTTDSNRVIGAVHPKSMPLILPRARWDDWLSMPYKDIVALAKHPYPDDQMEKSPP